MNNEFILGESELSKINEYSRVKLNLEDVYGFSVILCDNEIDRDYDRFSVLSLNKLSELFVGKTGIFDHNPKGENQTARIFDTEVVVDKTKKNSLGDDYTYLLGKAYMLKSDKNKDLILDIDGGIKKEVSISCKIDNQYCSICGADIKKKPCSHIKGKAYANKICHSILDNPSDAYEWSFVAIPAQRNAGVKKSFIEVKEIEKIKLLKNKISEDKKLLSLLYDELKSEVFSLSYLFGGFISDDKKNSMIERLDITELLDLKKSLKSTKQTDFYKPQTTIKNKDKNKSFKLN